MKRHRTRAVPEANPWLALGEQPQAPAEAVGEPLPVEPVRPAGRVLVVGVHGGSGASSVAVACGLDEAPAFGGPGPGQRVVLVARTHAAGLMSAQRELAAAADGSLVVVGLVLVADAPGRLPRELAAFADLVAGGVLAGTCWRLEWVPGWRLLPAPERGVLLDAASGPARRVLEEISRLAV